METLGFMIIVLSVFMAFFFRAKIFFPVILLIFSFGAMLILGDIFNETFL